MPLTPGLKMLIQSFNCEEGLPESVYNALCTLVEELVSPDGVVFVGRFVDSINNSFYLSNEAAEAALIRMLGILS